MLNIAVRAARAAGNVILRYANRIDELTITSKDQHDFVSEVDREAEARIIQILRKAYPDHAILAEESGASGGNEEYQWIIDPLDGTTNFLHGFPHFAVSIGLKHKGRLYQGVVYDPVREELYTASQGGGALLNDRRIRVTKQVGLSGALIGTGFPFRQPQHLESYLNMFRAVHQDTSGIRRAGSAALDLAYVAAGRLDGFWEIGLSPWDMAAGVLLVREAGGLVGDFGGGDDFLDTGNLVAAPPKVFPALLRAIRPHLGSALPR